MEGSDEFTELRRHPLLPSFFGDLNVFSEQVLGHFLEI